MDKLEKIIAEFPYNEQVLKATHVKTTDLKSNGQTIDYVLIDTEDKKVIKPKLLLDAESQLGRHLIPGEVPVRDPFSGDVKIKTGGLFYPETENEVREVPGPAGEVMLVSSNGLLISRRSNKVLNQNLLNGYPGHVTKIGGRDGENLAVKTHRAVAEAFVDNCDGKDSVNHKDGNKLNSHVRNLEWATLSENTQHAYENDLLSAKRGYDSPNSVLNREQVLEIKELLLTCKSRREVARRLNLGRWLIDDIANGVSYND